jgi:TonB family protein
MRFLTLLLRLAVVCSVALSPTITKNSFSQSSSSTTPQARIVVVRRSQPIYPPLARQTGITGDVVLSIGIRRDGSVESAVVISGHPLLKQAVLESIQNSEFECRDCTEQITPYSVVYTFLIEGTGCAPNRNVPATSPTQQVNPRSSGVVQIDQVTITAYQICIIDPVSSISVRSPKCLYFWRCGTRRL